MALQLPVPPARVAGTDQTAAAPWLATPQLKPADCVPEESVGAYQLLRRYGVAAPRQERIPASTSRWPALSETQRSGR